MQIRFDEIPADGLSIVVADHSWFPEHELRRLGEIKAGLVLNRQGRRVVVDGEFALQVELICDRCLNPYPWPVAGRFRLNLEVAIADDQDQAAEREHGCRAEEMDTVYLEAPVVDSDDLLAQQLYLSLPLKNLCREQCLGLCPGCGADLNLGGCACAPSGAGESSPFAALRKLQK